MVQTVQMYVMKSSYFVFFIRYLFQTYGARRSRPLPGPPGYPVCIYRFTMIFEVFFCFFSHREQLARLVQMVILDPLVFLVSA